MTSLRAGIVGASGYTGAELVRLVSGHPKLELAYVGAREKAGQRLGDVLPPCEGVPGLGDRVLEGFEPARAAELGSRLDVAFTALPHAASARAGKALLEAGIRVVDLSADFRLKSAESYAAWYGEHPAVELLPEAVYGLPELHRDELRGARLIAAPGCYPTSSILPLAPLLSASLVEPDGIVVDSKSGVSGAGRSASAGTHFPETAEGLRPYKVAGTHRHVPEIEQELSRSAGRALHVVFTPHLAPFTRGILTTAYARAKPGTTAEACRDAAREAYREGLVSVLPEGRLPDTLWVRGSARAFVAYALDERVGTLVAMCAIDNLAKGASAQAIQALNVCLGLPDALGLPLLGTFP
ncbi:MAG: N-acetyl-gamma-glutamyl-phosphate reductase [Polyangiaceae bacterium]|nr:N-acetyl-gamma-glutamyl-phosphate reductase [Polyangiaceae bacterium]MCE7891787.1 N-acetyl-gamma-glutamyl-phosphate reductase [Sorangiineae bacterium PRO1]MCL4751503.1 N-acetyl-gamma-glutamyl-phosphate reductase [Myxococcales bacterium]